MNEIKITPENLTFTNIKPDTKGGYHGLMRHEASFDVRELTAPNMRR